MATVNPFIPKDKRGADPRMIFQLLYVPPSKGDVGIEIECEGNFFRKDNLPYQWTYHKDHSLRGADNAEYVLKKPILFSEVEGAVKALWKMFEEDKTVLDISNRTSVHIHLNAQTFHLNRLVAFASLYYIVEEILTEWCGEHRVGNLFCLRGIDAPGTIDILKEFVQASGSVEISPNFHYASLNMNALLKFGSMEIRTLRGATDPDTIIKWVNILRRIYELSDEYQDPRVVVEELSYMGPEQFLNKILGTDTVFDILEEIKWTYSQVRESMYTGVRLAQDLCYCVDWSGFTPIKAEIDPFGRVKVDTILDGLAASSPLSVSPLLGDYQSFLTPEDEEEYDPGQDQSEEEYDDFEEEQSEN